MYCGCTVDALHIAAYGGGWDTVICSFWDGGCWYRNSSGLCGVYGKPLNPPTCIGYWEYADATGGNPVYD